MNDRLPEWVDEYKWYIALGLSGLFLMGVGGVVAVRGRMEKDGVVEIVQKSESNDVVMGSIMVDVSGAVEKPGVYEFTTGDRVNDALIVAGGLSVEANREYVSRHMNLAEELKDGIKLYIPYKDDPSNSTNDGVGSVMGVRDGLVNINTASISQLDSLWGIGSSRAQSIVDGRPYSDVSELKDKAGIPDNVIDKMEEKATVY